MDKDTALKLALEALRSAAAELYRASSYCNTYEVLGNTNDAITAIQQALAAQQEHEPENEPHVSLASVQEPVAWMQSDEVHISLWKDDYHTIPLYTTPLAQPAPVREDWGPGPHEVHSLPAPVQEPVRWSDYEPDGRRYPAVPDAFGTREGEHPQYIQGWNEAMDATQPAAQRPWVGLSEEEIDEIFNNHPTYHLDHYVFAEDVMSKYEEKNGAVRSAVPDALNPKDENPAYAAGWNDCRAEMLRGMKP